MIDTVCGRASEELRVAVIGRILFSVGVGGSSNNLAAECTAGVGGDRDSSSATVETTGTTLVADTVGATAVIQGED